jgi:hypothetical protein
MKKVLIAFIAFISIAAVVLLPTDAREKEKEGVKQAIEYYFQGHATGNGEFFKKAFHTEAKLFAVRDGKFFQLTSADYIARASGKPPADEAQRKRWIENIDITGNAATVKVVLDYPQVKFTDYMSLLKVDGEWKIINKTFYTEQKTAPQSKP